MCLADHTVERHPCHLSHSEIAAAVVAGTEAVDIHPLSHMAAAVVVAVDSHPCFHIEAVAAAVAADTHPCCHTVAEAAVEAVGSRPCLHIAAENLQTDNFETQMNTGSTAHHNCHMAHMHLHMGSLGCCM